MFNPFREHFWRHVWGPWSEPFDGTSTNKLTGVVSKVSIQERVCRVCGKRHWQTL